MTDAFQKALQRPKEQKGKNREAKQSGFRAKKLKEYSWIGILKKVYLEEASLHCCEKKFNKASTARDHIYMNHRDGRGGYEAPNAVIVGFGKKKERDPETPWAHRRALESCMPVLFTFIITDINNLVLPCLKRVGYSYCNEGTKSSQLKSVINGENH